MGWNDYVTRLNFAVADSWVGVWFKLDDGESMGRRTGAVFTTELRAGLTTFAAMAYIISVNASIISATGGTCICETTPDQCSTNAAYAACKEIVRRDLITSTAAASCIASFLMGAFANLPVGLAPGLGLNAYFTYSVVGVNGTGRISYREALAAVFLEGWLFFFMSIFGVRIWLARLIPRSLTLAVGAGIGLFIALIGLSPNGIGVVGGDYSNIVGLGGCPSEFADPAHPAFCLSHTLQSPQMWLGIFLGGIVTVLMMMYRVRGAIIIGIFLVSVCSWPRNSPVTVFPDTTAGNSSYDYFKQVVGFYPLRKVGAAVDFNYKNPRVWQALVTFLYVDLFDTTGTLYAMAKFSGVVDPVTKDFERSTVAYCVDALSISMGSLLGTSPVTAFIESATGISDGGKTGLTAISVSFFFFLSVFFSPIFASIPDYATGGALVICGCLMIRNVSDINWRYTGDAVPAFLTLIIIPFTYNIAYGLIAGLATFCILNGFAYLGDIMSGGEWVPPGYYTEREPWVFPQDGLLPGWLRRLFRGKRQFWLEDREANGGALSYLDQQRQLELQMAAQHHSLVDNPHAAKFRDSSTTGTGTGSFDEEQGMVHHDVVDIELDLDLDGDRDGEGGPGITRPQRSYSASYVRGRPTGVRRGSSARGVGKEKSQVKVTVDEVDLDADSTSDERRRHDRYLKDQSLASSSSSSSRRHKKRPVDLEMDDDSAAGGYRQYPYPPRPPSMRHAPPSDAAATTPLSAPPQQSTFSPSLHAQARERPTSLSPSLPMQLIDSRHRRTSSSAIDLGMIPMSSYGGEVSAGLNVPSIGMGLRARSKERERESAPSREYENEEPWRDAVAQPVSRPLSYQHSRQKTR